VPVAHVCAPRTKPWVADTKVTDAGLKPVRETAAVDGAAVGEVTGPLGGAAGDETAGALDAGADVPAGAAGDEAAGALCAGALLPGEAECVLLEQPAAAIRARTVRAAALVVQEEVMRSRTQQERVRVHVSHRSFRRRQSNSIQSHAAARR